MIPRYCLSPKKIPGLPGIYIPLGRAPSLLIDSYSYRTCSMASICGDLSADGSCDFTDILYPIDYIFGGGSPPVGYPGSCGS
jgi:hypothetical protein